MPSALQVIGLLYYFACAIGYGMALLIYDNARCGRDGVTPHPGRLPGAVIIGLLWPLTLPAFGIFSAVRIIRFDYTASRSAK